MRFPISRLGLMSAAVAGVCALPVPFAGANAQTAPAITLTPMKMAGEFLGKKKNKTAADLSGISCIAPNGASRICLAVNDENKNAQFVTIEANQMTVGHPVTLIGDDPDVEHTLGSPPTKVGCSAGPGDFSEMDGEGVAFSAPYFYVVGSHGCSRKKNEFRLSSFILSRIRVDDAGKPAAKDAVQNTFRVSDVLRSAGEASKSFGMDLTTAAGLNIEGIAVDGDRIWFGLRAPVKDSGAFLVEASLKDLFEAGHAPSKAAPIAPISIALGKLGIRDLAVLPDKRLLILAGDEDPGVPFRIFIFNPADGTKDERGTLPAVTAKVEGKEETGKAEAITVLDMDANNIRAVVLFDELPDGAAQIAVIPRK
jgi:hypothetical protein